MFAPLEGQPVVDLDDKQKTGPAAEVLYYGTWHGALKFTKKGREAWNKKIFDTVMEATTDAPDRSDGPQSSAASTGDRSSAASTGYRSSAASTGDRSSAASTGYQSSAASTGDRSSAASTGYRSSAASTGDQSSAASTGDRSAALLTGTLGTIEIAAKGAGVVTADEFTWIVHLGAVVLTRWASGHATLTTDGLNEGERVSVNCGKITREAVQS